MSVQSLPESCDVDGSGDDDSSVNGQVFIGNTVLVVGILFAIFFFHVAVISAVEAYWLAQVRSIETCAQPSDGCFVRVFEFLLYLVRTGISGVPPEASTDNCNLLGVGSSTYRVSQFIKQCDLFGVTL